MGGAVPLSHPSRRAEQQIGNTFIHPSGGEAPMSPRLLTVVALGVFVCATIVCADEERQDRGFTVDFRDCTEFVGWGPVPLAHAQPLVPAGFQATVNTDGSAGIVVRTTTCAGARVEGSPAQPTIVSQIGINLIAPDGTGDINNYTVIYVTNNAGLVARSERAGLPAVFDPALTSEFTYDSTGQSGELYVTAQGPELPAYFLAGTESDPAPNSAISFLANWWFVGHHGVIKQATTFPQISFGPATVTLYTSRVSALGNLIGGNTDGHFTILAVRGIYPAAHMEVTIR
jgi:hypothetical protein